MFFIKEDTAATIKLGPFVDKGDGVAYEVGMAAAMNHADTGVRISKNGGAFAARNTATIPVYDAFGYYLVNLDSTDTNTNGTLQVIFGDAAVCLPCEAELTIIPITLWDTLFVAQPAAAIKKFFNVAAPTATCLSLPDAVPGAAGGAAIAGSNAATTFSALTVTNALLVSGTTTLAGAVELSSTLGIVGATTFTGAVALSSTLATGAVTLNALTVTNLTTLTGNVSLGGTLGVTGVTTFTGAVNANITGDITGNVSGSVGTCAAATISAIGANAITGTSLDATACTKIIDDFETQSQADPTGFHVNLKEINGTNVAGDGAGTPWGP